MHIKLGFVFKVSHLLFSHWHMDFQYHVDSIRRVFDEGKFNQCSGHSSYPTSSDPCPNLFGIKVRSFLAGLCKVWDRVSHKELELFGTLKLLKIKRFFFLFFSPHELETLMVILAVTLDPSWDTSVFLMAYYSCCIC